MCVTIIGYSKMKCQNCHYLPISSFDYCTGILYLDAFSNKNTNSNFHNSPPKASAIPNHIEGFPFKQDQFGCTIMPYVNHDPDHTLRDIMKLPFDGVFAFLYADMH